MSTANTIRAIFIKDVVTEFRAKEVTPTMIVLGMLIVWVLRLVAEVGSINVQAMGPAALWVAFLFAALLAQERSFATEQHQDCISGLLLAPVDPGAIYLAKFLVNITMLCIFEIILVPIVILIFKLSVTAGISRLIITLLLGNVAISSIGTLFSAMVHISRIRGSVLSVLVLTVLMPVMIPATFALMLCFGQIPTELVGTGALAMAGNFKTAIGYLIGFDLVFTTAAWLLFSFIVQD
jgi:heme exporter protein B